MRKVAAVVAAMVALAGVLHAQTPVTTHPRLWVRAEDLPRLRSWAVTGTGLIAWAARASMNCERRKVR